MKFPLKVFFKGTVLLNRFSNLFLNFEIPGKTIQHGDLAFDKNHDLLSACVFILQAKHLIKYYLKMGMQRGNT